MRLMNETIFKIGSEVFHGNTRHRVIQVLDLEHLSVRNSFTGAVRKFHISELSSSPNNPDDPIDIVPATELLTIPDETWIEVNNKALLFNQVMQENDEVERRSKLKDAAVKLGISEPTAYRQLQRYKESDGNPLSLMRKKRDDSGRFEPEVEELIQKYIGVYLTPIKPSIASVYRDLELEIYQINKERKKENLESLSRPHINTLRHRISLLSGAEVAERLGISSKTLYNWVRIFSQPPEKRHKQEDMQAEIAKLKKQLKRAEQERDILKEAGRFFANESKNDTPS